MMSYKINEVKKMVMRKLRGMVGDEEGCLTLTISWIICSGIFITLPTLGVLSVICDVPLIELIRGMMGIPPS